MSKAIRLVPIVLLDTASQLRVREIRNEDDVRKWMYTDHAIGETEHLAWIDRLKQDDRQIVLVVLDDLSSPLGVVSVNAIDRLHQKADWAYYLTGTARGGLGSALEFAFIDFVFDVLAIEKLNCEVIQGNDAVVKLHKKFGFVEEGFRRANMLKNANRIGVHYLGLTKPDWQSCRASLLAKYQTVFDKFEIAIQWPTRPSSH